MASVTKAITSTALMVLHERKQIDLDQPANRYLSRARLRSARWNADDVTVRQIATHTAGLTTFDSHVPLPPEEVLRRYGVVFWRPGERYDYSNLGYGVLGRIIADVTGRSFQSFVHDEVLRPLETAHTWAGATPPPSPHAVDQCSETMLDFAPPRDRCESHSSLLRSREQSGPSDAASWLAQRLDRMDARRTSHRNPRCQHRGGACERDDRNIRRQVGRPDAEEHRSNRLCKSERHDRT